MNIKSLISLILAVITICSFAVSKKFNAADSDGSAKTTTNGTMNCVQQDRLTEPEQDADSDDSAEKTTNGTMNCLQQKRLPEPEQDADRPEETKTAEGKVVGDCEAINGVSVVADSNGIRFVNEKTGKETPFCSDSAVSVLYDGNTVYYVNEKDIIDKSVKIRTDEGPVDDEDSAWFRYEVYKYTVKNGKTEKLFKTNGYDVNLVYFDSENLYYTDVADKNIGYYGAVDSGTPSLFKYNFKSGKRTLISEYACRAEAYENCIFYTACDESISYEPSFVYPGPVHIYNPKTGRDVKVDDSGELLYAENGRFYFIHLSINEDSLYYNGSIIGGVVKSCKADGTDVRTGIEIKGNIIRREGAYIAVAIGDWDNDDWIENVVNTKTGAEFKRGAYSYYSEDDMLLAADQQSEEEPRKIYSVNDSGKNELFIDLDSYKGVRSSESYFAKSDNGIYVLKSEETEENQYKNSIRFIKAS